MTDAKLIDARLAARLISRAREAAVCGHAVGTTAEQIAGALLNGRSDWLPECFPDMQQAINRLHAEGAQWWPTMLAVRDTGWRREGERSASEALD
ncbi:hypothetical protein [Sphingomonas solaris]|uniref:Uncharacterized protein n=1 Tax=Alterirhizorhabdus solaris TaxID=2529389 RepID=A0A558R5S3_9SPHN|nr:hypothetical protein [Sphingomonas solaris]TVV74733.1 hypothetical protein FOY91_08760 [Sphingomonas solaris]